MLPERTVEERRFSAASRLSKIKVAASAAKASQCDHVWSRHSCPLPLTLTLIPAVAKNTKRVRHLSRRLRKSLP